MEPTNPLFELRGVGLSYGSVTALKNIDMVIERGEIHALVGEHGAGKSSLAAIIGGDVAHKKGTILFDGKVMEPHNVHEALERGIKSVYQQILLNEHFSVAESLYYTNKAVNKRFWISKRRMIAAAERLLQENALQIQASKLIRHLNLSDRTVVDILRCLVTATSLLIIDEGLDNLSTDSYAKIVRLLRRFKSEGMTILFITHKIDDVYSIADRVSIIRDGSILVTDRVGNIDKLSLVRLTYTQISKGDADIRSEQDFYAFLKYNEAILRNLPLALIVVDADQQIKLLNNSCRSLLKWGGENIGESLLGRLGPVNAEVYKILNGAFSKAREDEFYHVRIDIQGRFIIANIQTLPITDNETVIGHIIIIEDVTEYERMQKQLILSEKLASVGLLAAGVAHEINNPLEIIYNYLTFLRYNYADDKLLSMVEKISHEIMTISGIVSNLVSFSENSSSSIEAVDANELCKDILNLVKYNAKYKEIHALFTEGTGVPRIAANRGELRQVILNLIKNSFEAMPSGGTIEISTERAEEQGQSYVVIKVRDEGHGLEEKEIENIFMPFFSTKQKTGSNLGLGLSISYSIIEKYQGRLSARNNRDKGCTFAIRLPAMEDGPPRP